MFDITVTFDAKDFELNHPEIQKVSEIFQDLEFKRLTDNFIKTFSTEEEASSNSNSFSSSSSISSSSSSSSKASAGAGQFSLFSTSADHNNQDSEVTSSYTRITAETTSNFYQSVAPGLATKLFIKNLMHQISLCFDTETTNINPINAELVGISFSWEVGKKNYSNVN